MKVRHRFRFYPTPGQEIALAKLFGCVRWTFNQALQLRSETYKETGKSVSYGQTSAHLTGLKKDPANSFLCEVSCVPLQQALRQLQAAYSNFFSKRAKYPRFRSKRGPQSAEFTRSGFVWNRQNRQMRVSKIGTLRVKWSRVIKSEPSSITIIKDAANRYFVTLTVEETRDTLPGTECQAGIDLGLKTLAVLSTGETIQPLKPLRKSLRQLRRAGKVLSRRIRGSNRFERQRLKLARLHAQVADTRKDYLEKVTTDIVRRFGLIAIEDLNVRGMGRNRKMSRAIADAGFSEFRRMLEYKCQWYGRELRMVDRFEPTSKRCSCGWINQSLKLSDRAWTCQSCGANNDRDLLAANNILAAGHAVTARGGSVRRTAASAAGRGSRRNVNQPALECV